MVLERSLKIAQGVLTVAIQFTTLRVIRRPFFMMVGLLVDAIPMIYTGTVSITSSMQH